MKEEKKNVINRQIQNNKQKTEGITLIALIITIIVLLILAGISIAVLSGDNGILNKTNLARENEIKAEMKEKLILAILELQTEKLGQVTLSDITQKYIDSKMNEYENKVTEEELKNSKKIEIKYENIVRIFIIDERLNIIEIEENENYYNIITQLEEGISLDNKVTKVVEKKPYEAKIIMEKDYVLETLVVKMAGEEIVVDKTTGEIKIETVTGDIEIIATAKKINNTLMLSGGNLEIEGISSQNVTSYENGKFGKCYDFTNASTAYMDLGSASKYLGTKNQFTIDMWVCATKEPSTSYGCLVNIGGSNVSGGAGFGFRKGTTKIPYLYMGSHRYSSSLKTIELNQWHHVALVRNDKTYITYIDGELASQAVVNYNIDMNLSMGIGCNLSYERERFIGYIDKIRITNTVRWTSNFDVSDLD